MVWYDVFKIDKGFFIWFVDKLDNMFYFNDYMVFCCEFEFGWFFVYLVCE